MSELTINVTDQNQATTLGFAVQNIVKGLAGGPVVVTLGREKRSSDMNSKMWPMLTDLSKQVDWYGHKLTKEEWKDVVTAAIERQKTVPGIEGGFVVLGVSTRKQSKEWFSNLIEIIYAFGSERNVQWSEKSVEVYEKYREAG